MVPNDAELVLQVGSIRVNQAQTQKVLDHGTSQYESTGSKTLEQIVKKSNILIQSTLAIWRKQSENMYQKITPLML